MNDAQELNSPNGEFEASSESTHHHRHRRRGHSHKSHDWQNSYKRTQLIRNLIVMAVFALLIVVIWYFLVSRPPA